jgi:hypothetical protein
MPIILEMKLAEIKRIVFPNQTQATSLGEPISKKKKKKKTKTKKGWVKWLKQL